MRHPFQLRHGSILGAASLTAGILAVNTAQADDISFVRRCDYQIRVKSQAAGINSMVIPNGRIASEGRAFKSDPGPKRLARHFAMEWAYRCVQEAVNNTGMPRRCRKVRKLWVNRGRLIRYNITNLRSVALNALCQRARQLQRRRVLGNYEIYLHTNETGDKRGQCSLRGPSHTILKGRNLDCQDGRAHGQREERFSGWYDKNGSAMRTHIRDYCHRRRGGARWQILKYEVNTQGKLRVKFRCF